MQQICEVWDTSQICCCREWRVIGLMDKSGLSVASPAPFIIPALALPAIGVVGLPSLLASFCLVLAARCLLHTLRRPRLLSLLMGLRASLANSRLSWHRSLDVRAAPLLLRALDIRSAPLLLALDIRSVLLLHCRTLDFLLPGRSGRLFLSAPLGWCGCPLFQLALIMLANYPVTRLVTVTLAAQLMLLLHSGIPVSRIAPLIDGQRGAGRSRAALPPVPSSASLLP